MMGKDNLKVWEAFLPRGCMFLSTRPKTVWEAVATSLFGELELRRRVGNPKTYTHFFNWEFQKFLIGLSMISVCVEIYCFYFNVQ